MSEVPVGAADTTHPLPSSAVLASALNLTGRRTGRPVEVLLRMRANHLEQWDAEDQCRAPAVSVADLGRLKRRIDQLNAVRSELIDQIDGWVGRSVRQSRAAPPHTETYGALLDRIVISWLRLTRASPVDSARYAATALQHRELMESYDVLLTDVRAGTRRLPDWRSLKSYGASTAEDAGRAPASDPTPALGR